MVSDKYLVEIEGEECSAKVVADSIFGGVRLTTLELYYPRFIHSEFMTHRVFSRNASSSRAIPISKMIDRSMATPIHWGKNKPGMSASEEIEQEQRAKAVWERARSAAIRNVRSLEKLGVHKQVANRILEPFQYMSTVVTATDWDNFFNLRIHEAAQPEIRELATVMKKAMDAVEPAILKHKQWHSPYSDDIRRSVARCARVSYSNHNGESSTEEEDLRLHDMLKDMKHLSPFEHQAIALGDNKYHANFKGFKQYRALLASA